MAWPTWTAATRSVAAAFGALLLLAALLRVPHARLADQSGSARSDSESLAQATCVDRAAGPVLDGYDVVAYHSLNADAAAVAGSSSHTATVFGYTWSVIAPHAVFFSHTHSLSRPPPPIRRRCDGR